MDSRKELALLLKLLQEVLQVGEKNYDQEMPAELKGRIQKAIEETREYSLSLGTYWHSK